MTFLEGQKIEKIYHLADLHIRNVKRHKEYKIVFQRFLDDVDSNNFDSAIIYIAGDIAHAKTEMSPELIDLISWFLKECANRHSTFLITGNHDCNQNNPSRMDALSPIIQNISHPDVHYLKDTGVHQIGDLTVVVYSILDHMDNWPSGTEIEGDTKICFFHGPINKSETDVGYQITSHRFTPSLFDGFDLALLGDIHKRQVVQDFAIDQIDVDEDEVEEYLKNGWELS